MSHCVCQYGAKLTGRHICICRLESQHEIGSGSNEVSDVMRCPLCPDEVSSVSSSHLSGRVSFSIVGQFGGSLLFLRQNKILR